MTEQMELIIFEIISTGGTAKGLAYEALAAAENGDFEEAEKLLKEADEALNQAHKVQTDIIQAEARGENTEVSVLFVHAQDHLMTAIEARNLIEKMIKMYKIIDTKLANLK
ncbi:PTS lactose/cellobiose transporter subunit IIA [Clostridium celatum]|uniref:PTS system, lactose-specific IIa component n=1 Tax=Clostridium celatum DSM 1785 TaxID=545697 RepID=L1QKU3_9CLOT|nr:PTS lactose/cellobiose transporter subunit IIA [Clostridium celatum]EKY28619.1 PTS system, lactose-specific IIa component [Clostridium celatum DSM 1785]MCE9654915.1 PTS lactose/cellobiose transporter subunit IIA [Clostridium celatum]MDU2265347.1 PTS lactose/cellobiose transporter subunit IIA [Clostridium celatum]MDU6294979.1 PTS lactose/cellobiose transporter subunit IIA [Clostridium celatum]MDY3360324.1 PTS lactose/cellobiose transporter subunit IIA [Clostridium celatum]